MKTWAQTFTEDCLDTVLFAKNRSGVAPVTAHLVPGHSALVLVVGENASGKSILRRIVSQSCKNKKIECLRISMEGRQNTYAGLGLSFIYGNEEYISTGHNSACTVVNGIYNCKKRERAHVMFWDEPDLGLSENGAAGVGVAIAAFVKDKPKLTRAIFVCTHSRALVRQLEGCKPHFLYFGDAPKTLQEWLNEPIVPRDLRELINAGDARRTMVQKTLDKIKVKK